MKIFIVNWLVLGAAACMQDFQKVGSESGFPYHAHFYDVKCLYKNSYLANLLSLFFED